VDPEPYHRHEFRKIRHRQTDTNRRIRIKAVIEKLRSVLYTDQQNVKAEQSQVIDDALNCIQQLREENASLLRRVEQLEQAQSIAASSHSDHYSSNADVDTDAKIFAVEDESVNNITRIEDHDLPVLPSVTKREHDNPSLVANSTPFSPCASTSGTTDQVSVYRIPHSLRNTSVAVWITSTDGRWLDVNMVFELSTSYTASDLYNRYTGHAPVYATAVLREQDPFDSHFHNLIMNRSTSTSLTTLTHNELPLGQGSPMDTDPVVFQRACETPLLFNTTWLDKYGNRHYTRFMCQVIRDDQTNKPLYILHMYYRGV